MIVRKTLDSKQVNLIDFMDYLRTPICTISNANSSFSFEWMNSDEAAEYLRLSVATLRNMTSAGEIPYTKLGRRNRYRKDQLRALLLENKRGPL
jgi:excisionase family DNA binding protein